MQKLEGRNTYTPTNIPHVHGNCGLPLNGKLAQGESVVVDGKTINPDMVYETNKRIIKLSYD